MPRRRAQRHVVTTASILSLQWPVSGTSSAAVVSYAIVTARNEQPLIPVLLQGRQAPSSKAVAYSVQSTLTATVTGSSCSNFACNPRQRAAASSGLGVGNRRIRVTLAVQAPEKTQSGTTTYSYRLTGVPGSRTT